MGIKIKLTLGVVIGIDVKWAHMDYSPGLRGIIAGETEISTVGMEGTSLRYRGYDAIELTKSHTCLLYTSPSPRDVEESRMPSSA